MPNKEKLLARINPATSVGLEIGPLTTPAVTKEDGEIYYLDHLSTEDLRRKYAAHVNVDTTRIVDVSFVAADGDLAKACGGKRFDYIIASHVIEHVPNLIGWLRQVAALLHTGGKLALAIPDKRYTFDRFRSMTPVGDLIQAWLEDRRVPSAKQIFDHCANVVGVDARAAWDGEGPHTPEAATRYHSLAEAFELAQRYFTAQEYYDVHCSVFTPKSFLDILTDISRLGLLDFVCIDFHDTARYEIEFYITLEKVYAGFDRDLQTESIRRFSSMIRDEQRASDAAETMRALESLQIHAKNLEREIEALRSSLSWKITSPLRWLARPIMRPRLAR
jgi:predicted SAM-dependent methyltransferase